MAWTILAKLYLNAKVYIGQDKNTECITYCNKIIASGAYSLKDVYANLFKADNNVNNPEAIFQVNYDGLHTQTYGGTNFIIHASIGGSMVGTDYGVDSGWGGVRTTKNLVDKFPDVTGSADKRAIFYTAGQTKDMPDKPNAGFGQGLAMPKYQNKTSAGVTGSNPAYADTDFPMFRLADVYLMYAEAVLRGGSGGSATTALDYVNEIRTRAYGDTSGNINQGQLDLNFIIDERSRELYWEAHRRTDLIRFGLFTDSETNDARAVWPWKETWQQARKRRHSATCSPYLHRRSLPEATIRMVAINLMKTNGIERSRS